MLHLVFFNIVSDLDGWSGYAETSPQNWYPHTAWCRFEHSFLVREIGVPDQDTWLMCYSGSCDFLFGCLMRVESFEDFAASPQSA